MSVGNAKRQKKILILVTALVWVAAIATGAGKFKLAAKGPITIELATRPTAVKVSINGERQFNGMYVETPKQMKIAAGANRIKISREGYVSNLFTVDALSGETVHINEVVLQKKSDVQFQPFEISHDEQSDPVYVSVANGFITGETPISADDAVKGSTYIITAFPAWPSSEPNVRCRFKLPLGENVDDDNDILKSRAYKVTIRRTRRGPQQLIFKGCNKLKQK